MTNLTEVHTELLVAELKGRGYHVFKAAPDVTLEGFIGDHVTYDITAKVTSSALVTAYSRWCDDRAEEPLKARALGAALQALGFRPARSSGARYWKGLSLR